MEIPIEVALIHGLESTDDGVAEDEQDTVGRSEVAMRADVLHARVREEPPAG